MKLVLAGSHTHYQRFIETLWRKDKDTSDYNYVGTTYGLRGFDRTTTIVKLGSFGLNPQHDEIWRECQARFDMRPRRERRTNEQPRISDGISISPLEGGLSYIDGPQVSETGQPMSLQPYGPRPEILQPHAGLYVPTQLQRFIHSASIERPLVPVITPSEERRQNIIREFGVSDE